MSGVTEVTSRNFTLRLSAADYLRLQGVAVRWRTDRTTVLRLLVRRAASSRPDGGLFIPAGGASHHPLPIEIKVTEETG